MVVFPSKKIGNESDEEVKRQEQEEYPEEFRDALFVEIHA